MQMNEKRDPPARLLFSTLEFKKMMVYLHLLPNISKESQTPQLAKLLLHQNLYSKPEHATKASISSNNFTNAVH